ncbi:hypothetical protein [Microbacterium sp. NPDC078849]
MSGQELESFKVDFECEVVDQSEVGSEASIVTVNPFVPSRYDAVSLGPSGGSPTMTLTGLLGFKRFMEFEDDRGRAIAVTEQVWPSVRMVFQYFLHENWPMFERTAKEKLQLDKVGSTFHERTSVAYQSLMFVTITVLGQNGDRGARIVELYGKKHSAVLSDRHYMEVVRSRGAAAKQLERDLFTAISAFIHRREAWEMGALSRYVPDTSRSELEQLVLYRDEFSIVRDLYQQGFELACKCLWPLVAAQNALERSGADDFGTEHPSIVPPKQRVQSLAQFDKLPNAYKVAYAAQVPGWDSLSTLLNNRRRNTIGHATAHHELRTGRVVSDQDPGGISYLDFLAETLGVFEAMTSLTQVLRAARVASSPDFGI